MTTQPPEGFEPALYEIPDVGIIEVAVGQPDNDGGDSDN